MMNNNDKEDAVASRPSTEHAGGQDAAKAGNAACENVVSKVLRATEGEKAKPTQAPGKNKSSERFAVTVTRPEEEVGLIMVQFESEIEGIPSSSQHTICTQDSRPGAHSMPGLCMGPRGLLTPHETPTLPPLQQMRNPSDSSRCHHDYLDLAEANPVNDPSEAAQAIANSATLVDLDRLEELKRKKKQQREQEKILLIGLLVVVIILVLIVAGVVIGLVFGSRQEERDTTMATERPIASPTWAPIVATTFAPSGPLDLLLMDLPNQTLQSLQTFNTPQWNAWQWLSNHLNISNLPEWKKKQLFVLATFFHALDGPHWIKPIRDRWLDDTLDECLWFSTAQGWINEEENFVLYEYTPSLCNEKGEYQILELSAVKREISEPLHSPAPSLPPEIAMLTALQVIDFGRNPNLHNQTFSNFVPSELFQMKNLTCLNLDVNGLHGSLPSELGLLTGLTMLGLEKNSISDTIPTQLGLLTKLTELQLQQNSLTGPLPTGLGLMSDIVFLSLEENELSGSIPHDLGRMTSTTQLDLSTNSFQGPIPSQVGLMTSLVILDLSSAGLAGALPSQLGLLTHTLHVRLAENSFRGPLSPEFCIWGCEMRRKSPFYVEKFLNGPTHLSLDQCQCHLDSTQLLTNGTDEVSINIRFDLYPSDVEWVFEELLSKNGTKSKWLTLDDGIGDWDFKYQIASYPQASVARNTLYRFAAIDTYGNGGCCGGMLSITTGPSKVLWTSLEENFNRFVEVYLWSDSNGKLAVVTEQEGLLLVMGS